MPDVQPFRGWRYDLARVGALSDVVAPPYDVIDPTFQTALYDRHPHNVIRLELNREETTDTPQANRYTRAARFLKDWQHDRILRQESDPALYVYHQSFMVEGKPFTRRGVLARVRLERFGEGKIYAHEETMPGPKADRLKLIHATGMNLSPIFGLYPDSNNEVQERLDAAVQRVLPLEATDHLGVVSRFWPVSDGHAISAVQRMLYPKPVFIADGHHRYETSIRYRDERLAAGEAITEESPENFVMMMLVGMSDPGLLILPTHRLVSGLPGLDASTLARVLSPHFEIEAVGVGEAGAREAWGLIEAEGAQEVLGLGTVADGKWITARLKSPDIMTRLAPEHSAAWRGLGVSILHVLVLEHQLKSAGQGGLPCKYVHLLDEVLQSVAARACDLAVLVPAATMDHVEQIAGNLEKMPPKSTYFYPKVLTGLVFNPVQ